MTAIERGRQAANLLRGCWRSSAADLAVDRVAESANLLQDEGLSGLVWKRLSPYARRTPVGRQFRRAAIADAGAAALLDGRLIEIVRVLRAAGVEPIVAKGWAVARYYPDPSTRAYSDLDLAIAPGQAQAARVALNALGGRSVVVDLHVDLADLPQRTWSAIWSRSNLVPIDGELVRVLSPEDQFRWLGVHFIRHVCSRPRWLIDLAVMLENAIVDWQVALRGSHTWRRWLLALAGLANRLLDARIPDQLAQLPGVDPPRWLDEMTLWWWGGGADIGRGELLCTPAEWLPFVANRKLNPVRWSYRFGLPPMSFLPPVWAAAMLGKSLQPLPRIWRWLKSQSGVGDTFATHEQRLF